MQADLFYQFLDQVAQWKLGTFPGSAGSQGRPPKDPDATAENPYVVVEQFKEVTWSCEHCNGTCTRAKTYSKIIDSPEWKCKCYDCSRTFKVTKEEMIKKGHFIIAKSL